MRKAAPVVAVLALLAVVDRGGRAAGAQEKVTLKSDVLLYGDNTEFRNPYREGATIGERGERRVEASLKCDGGGRRAGYTQPYSSAPSPLPPRSVSI